jgi:hypothetical protein
VYVHISLMQKTIKKIIIEHMCNKGYSQPPRRSRWGDTGGTLAPPPRRHLPTMPPRRRRAKPARCRRRRNPAPLLPGRCASSSSEAPRASLLPWLCSTSASSRRPARPSVRPLRCGSGAVGPQSVSVQAIRPCIFTASQSPLPHGTTRNVLTSDHFILTIDVLVIDL